jgi:hypothetical protein
MSKKIAVLVRDRQDEALRMAVGLTLMDDVIDVYVLDRKVNDTAENALNVETLKDLSMHVYTNDAGNVGMEFCPTEEIAQRLSGYDQILPY